MKEYIEDALDGDVDCVFYKRDVEYDPFKDFLRDLEDYPFEKAIKDLREENKLSSWSYRHFLPVSLNPWSVELFEQFLRGCLQTAKGPDGWISAFAGMTQRRA